MNNNNNKVLIISSSQDIHVDEVENCLNDKNQPYLRLNLDQFPREYDLALCVDADTKVNYVLTHIATGQSVCNKSIKSVWVRKRAPFRFVSDDLGVHEKKFAEQEVEHLLSGFLHSLDCYWMSHPKAIRAAQWKVEQLARATKFGFRTPATLISNNPERVLAFYHQHNKKIITKPLSESSLASEELAYDEIVSFGFPTTLVTEEHIEQIASVKEFPCNFQEYIEKQFELRVTVIGDQVFTARIDSQADPRTVVDLRDFSADIAYDAWSLPCEIASQCLELVKSYGLNFGAIDLIYTPDNEFVFLENNPGGQFWFVEQLVPELRMMEQVANCLIKAK